MDKKLFFFFYNCLGFEFLISSKAYSDLLRLYNLVNRVDLLESLRNYFLNYIKVINIYIYFI